MTYLGDEGVQNAASYNDNEYNVDASDNSVFIDYVDSSEDNPLTSELYIDEEVGRGGEREVEKELEKEICTGDSREKSPV